MKKVCIIAFVLVLTLTVMTGCRFGGGNDTTASTTASTTRATTAPTTRPATQPTTEPMMDDMIPGTEDTIDPTNGANQGTEGTNGNATTQGRSMGSY